MAFQKCSDAAVTDKGDRLPGIVPVENGLDGADDPRLRIYCLFPAVKTLLRMGEEPVRCLFEFRWRQEAGGRPVVFMHRLDDLYLSKAFYPPLTTVSQPRADIGRTAMSQLLNVLSDGDVGAEPAIVLPTTLNIRGSTAPPRK